MANKPVMSNGVETSFYKNIFTLLLLLSIFTLSPKKAFAEFTIAAGSMIQFDYDKTKESAPNPATFNGTLGGLFRLDKPLAIDFGVTFFMNYYDCTESSQVIFTEVENRTALALSFMVDGTLRYNKTFGKHRILVGGGVGILARFGIEDKTVPSDESWKISEINKAFWNKAAFLYPEVAFTWLYQVTETTQAGFELKGYFGTQQTMVALSAKVAFSHPKKSEDALQSKDGKKKARKRATSSEEPESEAENPESPPENQS